MYIFSLTILPPLIILFYFILSDRFREPKAMIIKTFFLGIAITIPAGYLNTFILDTFGNGTALREAFLSGFVGGGPVEEILKFLILYYFILREKEFNEPIKLSVISTYLARFTSKNKVERAKKGREWAYHTLKLTNTAPKLSEN